MRHESAFLFYSVRLFDRNQFDKYFECFKNIQLDEIETTRWGNKKYMWEFIYKK